MTTTTTKVKLIIGGLAAIGAAVSPSAHADPGTDHGNAQFGYTVDLARVGLTGDSYTEVVLGETICDNLDHGLPIVSAATRLINGNGVPAQTAVAIVALAVIDLCPQYTPQGMATPAPSQPIPVTIAGFTRAAAIA